MSRCISWAQTITQNRLSQQVNSALKRIITYILFALLICLPGHSVVRASPAGTHLSPNVTTQPDFSLRLKATLQRPGGKLSAIVLSPDARVLAVATEDGKTELWNTETGKHIADLKGRIFLWAYHQYFQPINVFSADGQTLVTMNDKEARLWETSTGQLKQILKGHTRAIRSVAFSPAGQSLAPLSADGTAKLWNVATGQLNATLAALQVKKLPRWRIVSRFFADDFGEVYFSPDSKNVLTVPYGQATKLWDAATGHLEAVLGDKNLDAGFSPSGRFVLTRGEDFRAPGGTPSVLWDTKTGQLKATLALPFSWAEFSPHEQWLGPVRYQDERGLLDLKTMKVEPPLTLISSFTGWILFSPDDRILLASTGLDHHTAKFVDTSTGKVIAVVPIVAKEGFDFISDYLKYVERLSFHPSSRILMGANQKIVRFWDVPSGWQIKEVTEGRDPAMFSRDGSLLVMASVDRKNVLLWEVKI